MSGAPYVDEPKYLILTNDEENKDAVATLFETLDERLPRKGTVKLGFPGANVGPVTAKYDENANLWWYHEKDDRSSYYWNSFGYGEPQWDGSVAATVEVSISKQYAKNGRRVEGAMVRDSSSGAVYLAHTGVLKGGKVKSGFREYHANKKGRDNHIVARDDRGNRKLILITNIRGPNASKDIAEYVKVAKEYKQGPGRREPSGASTDEEYRILTDDEENRSAVRTLFESLGKLAAREPNRMTKEAQGRTLFESLGKLAVPKVWVNLTSYPYGNHDLEVIPDRKSKIWWYKDPNPKRYYRSSFGYGKLSYNEYVSATVQFDIPRRYAKDRRTTAGAMVKDSKGTVYLAHTGRLGQNAKSGFEDYHASKKGRSKHAVARDNEGVRELILVTEIEGPDVSKNIADYLSVVEEYKRGPGRKEYRVLVDERKIDEHNQRFHDNLKDKDTKTIEAMNLDMSGGPVRDAKYNAERNIWWWSSRGSQDNRYRNCFGVGTPKQTGADSMASSGDNPTHSVVTSSIAVEINFPRSRADRMVDGALIEDEDGKVYVTHSGGLDKRRKDSRFKEYYGRKYNWIEADDGKPDKRSLVLISSIDDPDLLGRVADFVKDMSRFNADPKKGAKPSNPKKGAQAKQSKERRQAKQSKERRFRT